MSKSKIIQRQYIHSNYIKLNDGDAVVVKEKIKYNNGEIKPNLRIIKNPKRSFYITKPRYRTHKYKKEFEHISKLDKYTCYNFELVPKLRSILKEYGRSKYLNRLLNNPYVYGADIDIEALIKMKYMDMNEGKEMLPITTGFFDIETSTLDDTIILISFIHENHVYTAFLEKMMFQYNPKTQKMEPFTLEDIKQKIKSKLIPYIKDFVLSLDLPKEKTSFKFKLYPAKNERDLILWIFDKIHQEKTDFVGIWNMNFDIPKVIQACRRNDISVVDIFTHPSLPLEYRTASYFEDKSKVDHFTLKWHWLYNTGHTKFIDSMSLYSILRKTSGYESSYKLDYILEKNIGLKKLPLGEEQSHTIMQGKYFLDYIVYNIFDAIGPQLMEWINNDIQQMYVRSGVNPLHHFSRMTKYLTHEHYYFYKKIGYIIGSVGADKPFYEDILFRCECGRVTGRSNNDKICPICQEKVKAKFGGAVLRPENVVDVGINIFNKDDQFTGGEESLLSVAVADEDLSSAYPTNTEAYNIAMHTALFTAFQIKGRLSSDVYDYFGNLMAKKENSVVLMNKYFNIPSYKEVYEYFENILKSKK